MFVHPGNGCIRWETVSFPTCGWWSRGCTHDHWFPYQIKPFLAVDCIVSRFKSPLHFHISNLRGQQLGSVVCTIRQVVGESTNQKNVYRLKWKFSNHYFPPLRWPTVVIWICDSFLHAWQAISTWTDVFSLHRCGQVVPKSCRAPHLRSSRPHLLQRKCCRLAALSSDETATTWIMIMMITILHHHHYHHHHHQHHHENHHPHHPQHPHHPHPPPHSSSSFSSLSSSPTSSPSSSYLLLLLLISSQISPNLLISHHISPYLLISPHTSFSCSSSSSSSLPPSS